MYFGELSEPLRLKPEMTRQDRLYDRIRKGNSLRKAWAKIYENGKQSDSEETINLVNEYKQNEEENLKQLSNKLRKNIFDFGSARGIAGKKKSKKLRPIVSASIEARVVQRAILDELSHRKEILKFFSIATSFGAIPGKGVPEAIKATVGAIQGGAKYYIKSDVVEFFTKIPRAYVVEQISCFWNDNDFSQLLEKATNIEIDNLADLERKHGAAFRDKFVFDKTGTPQGCCLSPLIGNVLLHGFDEQMNTQDITCLRYLDDFIIMGPTYRAVHGAFYKKAQRLLSKHGLEAYDLETHPDKASQGTVDKAFEFLGIEFKEKLIRPSSKSRKKLIMSIRNTLGGVLNTDNQHEKTQTLVNALYYISNMIRGWGNQYKFCNDTALMGSIDAEIAQLIVPFFFKFGKSMTTKDQDAQRRFIGIWSLKDCKKEPISF
jgi:RNA-directed DNA polymerase